MDGRHPNPIDPRPKRRKEKDNPYTIFTTGIQTGHPRYYLSFRDAAGVQHCLEIDKGLFDTLDQFELDDLSFMNEVDRHYEQSEQTEASLNSRAVVHEDSVEETVQRRMEAQELHEAIARLPEVQRRRLVLYYFASFTYEQIAAMEGCTHPAVRKSIVAALQKLKDFLSGGVTI